MVRLQCLAKFAGKVTPDEEGGPGGRQGTEIRSGGAQWLGLPRPGLRKSRYWTVIGWVAERAPVGPLRTPMV